MQLMVTIAALIIALPACCNALVSLYDRFLAKPGAKPMALSGGSTGLWALRLFNVIGLCLLGAIIVQTWLATTPSTPNQAGVSSQPLRPPPAPSQPPAPAEDDPSTKSVAEILRQCEGHTQLQCEIITASNAGKEIDISGIVSSVFPSGGVFIEVGKTYVVGCFFAEKWKPRLAILRKGDAVKATGKISFISLGSLVLKECDLRD
jgi:hypothetical protein